MALTALASAAETGKQKDPEIDVLYSIQGTAISDELRAAYPCVLPSVLSDAQRQAQNIAAAARVRVGSIVAMADETGLQGAVSYPTAISGTFGPAPYLAFGNLTNPRPSRLCLMTVQFKLLR